MKYVLLSEKSWHKELYEDLLSKWPNQWELIDKKGEFTLETLSRIQPSKIFIPHWSYIIPSEIYESFECIVFHMTDLPFGRGGSPLQNLIVRGMSETKISALKVTDGVDTGDIYLKYPLSLYGTAEEIFLRAAATIKEMIEEILSKNIKPVPQVGEIVQFKRRKPSESDIANLESINQVYDYIRMLDAEGYPHAFIDIGKFRLEFSKPTLKSDNSIIADVRIFQK